MRKDKPATLFLLLTEVHPDQWKEKDITLQTGINIPAEDTSLRKKDNLLTKKEDGLHPHLECCLQQDLGYPHSQTDTGTDLQTDFHTDLHIKIHTDHLHTNPTGDHRPRIHTGIERRTNMKEDELDMEEDQVITDTEDNNSSKYITT